MPRNPETPPVGRGIYSFFWETLRRSRFVNDYFEGPGAAFRNYIENPTDPNACTLVEAMTRVHEKSAPAMAALSTMNMIEQGVGQLRDKHRAHLVHSVNVLLLGLCLTERFPELKRFLLAYPGESVTDLDGNPGDEHHRESVFHFRWILACLFHDIGYVFELLAKGLDPDDMGVLWEGTEELRRGMRRLKADIQCSLSQYIGELRELPIIPLRKGYDDNNVRYFPENGHRQVREEKDILRLFAYVIGRSHGHWRDERQIFQDLQDTLDRSFKVGIDNTFDHGKIGAFLFLHEIRTCYVIARAGRARRELSWHRANVYFDVMDAAAAIYLHNTLRFDLVDRWGKCEPSKTPPLAYLLTLCDLLVEWDRRFLGHGTPIKIDGSSIRVAIPGPKQLEITYQKLPDVAANVGDKIRDMFDETFLDVRVRS